MTVCIIQIRSDFTLTVTLTLAPLTGRSLDVVRIMVVKAILLFHCLLLLALHAPVLEPCLDLSLTQVQSASKLHPIRYAEVLLVSKFSLEAIQLLLCEDSSKFSFSSSVTEQMRAGRVQVFCVEGRH